MRKTKIVALATMAALAAGSMYVPAENTMKVRADEYLIIDLGKVLNEAEVADTEESAQDSTPFYLDLLQAEDTGVYDVTGSFVEEPILAQLLAQNEAFAGFDAAGFYEITGDTQEDLEQYSLNLVLADDANLYHYSMADGELVKAPLEVLFGEEQEHTISVSSATNHWFVIHLKAAEATVEEENSEASTSMEGQVDESNSSTETSAATEESTTAQATTKTPETTAPTTTPEKSTAASTAAPTTAPTTAVPTTATPTTAHTHVWVPVTKTVHHEATYKDVWVQDSAAWDETVVTKEAWDENVLVSEAWDENVLVSAAWDEPQLEWCGICNACGHVFRAGEDINEHMAAGCWSSWHDEWVQVGTTHHDAVYQTVHHDAVYQTVHHDAETTTVHHEATGHNERVVDQAAWDETVTTGYKCSSCGATK